MNGNFLIRFAMLLSALVPLRALGDVIYYTDNTAGREGVWQILPDGTITQVVSLPGTNPVAMTSDNSGNLYVSEGQTGLIVKVAPDHSVSRYAGPFHLVAGLAFSPSGTLYASILPDMMVVGIAPTGEASTLATGLYFPSSLSLDFHGNVYAFDQHLQIQKITPTGSVSLFSTTAEGGVVWGPDDTLYSGLNDGTVTRTRVDGTTSTLFKGVYASVLGVASDGDLYVYDYGLNESVLAVGQDASSRVIASGIVPTSFAVNVPTPSALNLLLPLVYFFVRIKRPKVV